MEPLEIEKLTIGQMARINHVSEQTLRLYDRMGILKPNDINKQTGYRYYSIRQCAHLDMIQYMKSMGMSLDMIKEQLGKGDVIMFREVLQHQLRHLDKKIKELKQIQEAVKRSIINYDRYLSAPPDGIITTEFIHGRKIYCYSIDFNFYDQEIEVYELILQKLKSHIRLNNLSMNAYYNVGNIIRKPYVEERKLYSDEIFLFINDDFFLEDIEFIPAGLYVCIYCDSNYKERDYTLRLLEYIDHNGLTVTGDYLCEVVAELPVFKESGRNMYIKLQIPVKY